MGMRWTIGVVTLGARVFLAIPAVSAAADEAAAEATHPLSEENRQQILQTIEATRQTDPELATEMENQLKLLESGQLNLNDNDFFAFDLFYRNARLNFWFGMLGNFIG